MMNPLLSSLRRNTLLAQLSRATRNAGSRPLHQARANLIPHVYDTSSCTWRTINALDSSTEFKHDKIIKIVSWNVDYSSSLPASRIATLLGHLQKMFMGFDKELVILLQEVSEKSLQQVLKTSWISSNFAITGIPPPMIMQGGMRRLANYFNLMLTPRDLRISKSWRLSLPSEMGRDAIFVDIPTTKSTVAGQGMLRLCTTHLESLDTGIILRKKQLQLITENLCDCEPGHPVVCGVVGGDFNSIEDVEHVGPTEMGLMDAWAEQEQHEDEGHTWGLQSSNHGYLPRRFDKFLYTGSVCIIPAVNSDGLVEAVQRLGRDLKTDVIAEEQASDDEARLSTAVSDHLGITMGVRII